MWLRFVCFVLDFAIFDAVRFASDGAWELPVEIGGPLARPHGEGVADVAGGEGLIDMDRILTTFDISGTLSRVRNITDENDRDNRRRTLDRAWWVIEFEEGTVVLIRMWSGELDLFHNKQRVHKLNRENKPTTILQVDHGSLLHSVHRARYFLENWQDVEHGQIGKPFVLHFAFIAAGRADPGSCRVQGKGAMSRAAATWYGLLKEQNLWLNEDEVYDNTDEEDDSEYFENDTDDSQRAVLVGGQKGAEVFDVVLGLWAFMRDLEYLWSSWYLGSEQQNVLKLQARSTQRLQHLSQRISTLQDGAVKKTVTGWLSLWRRSMTQEGVAAANLAEARQVPLIGLAVRMKSGEVVRVHSVIGNDDAKSFTINALSTTDRSRRYSQQEWAVNVAAIVDVDEAFPGSIGAEVIRYGESFRVLSEPQEARTPPIEGAKFASVRLFSDPNANESVGLVDPECGDHHPFVGAQFRLLQKAYRGFVYEVVSVVVAVESKNITLLRCKVVEGRRGVHTNLVHAYNASVFSKLIRNRQIRLDLPIKDYSMGSFLSESAKALGLRKPSKRTKKRLAIMEDRKYIQRHLIVVAAKGTSLRVRRTAQVDNFHMFIVKPSDRLHHTIVSRRTTELLKLTITDVYAPPNYEADDRAKRRKFAIDMTINTVVALLVVAQMASIGSLAFIGIPVLLAHGIPAALGVMQATIFTTLNPILGIAMQVSPRGAVGGMVISGFNQFQASKIAFQTLTYAERMSSLTLASEFCPLGSGLDERDFRKFKNKTNVFHWGQYNQTDEHGEDQYGACKRHKLRETDRQELHADENRKRRAQGLRPRMYSKFERDGHALGWFMRPTLEAKAARRFRASVFSMTQLSRALAYVTEQGCEVVADVSQAQNYRLRERWTLTPRTEE
jgi:hypothetical protein